MRLSPDELDRMQVGRLFRALYFYNRRQQEQQQIISNLVRAHAVVLVNMQLPTNKRIKRYEELWRFPWDGEEDNVMPNVEAAMEAMKRIEELIK